MINIDFLKITS